MCMFSTPSYAAPDVSQVAESAQSRAPDQGAAAGAGRRAGNRVRAGMSTVLTSSQGALNTAPTQMKTLLGQ